MTFICEAEHKFIEVNMKCFIQHFMLLQVIAPWRLPEFFNRFKGRLDLFEFAKVGRFYRHSHVKRDSSGEKWRTRNLVSLLGSNPPFATFSKFGHTFFFSPRRPSSLSCVNECLAVDSGGNVSELSSGVIAAWPECFPEKSSWCRNEQVFQGVKCI